MKKTVHLISIYDASVSRLLRDYFQDVILPDLKTPIYSIRDLSVIITGLHASAKELEGTTTEEYNTHLYDTLAIDVDHLMRWMKAHQIMFIHIDAKEMDDLEKFVRNL